MIWRVFGCCCSIIVRGINSNSGVTSRPRWPDPRGFVHWYVWDNDIFFVVIALCMQAESYNLQLNNTLRKNVENGLTILNYFSKHLLNSKYQLIRHFFHFFIFNFNHAKGGSWIFKPQSEWCTYQLHILLVSDFYWNRCCIMWCIFILWIEHYRHISCVVILPPACSMWQYFFYTATYYLYWLRFIWKL